MRNLTLSVAFGALAAFGIAQPAAAESGPAVGLPFVGNWDCDYGVFIFTDLHYWPASDDPLDIQSVVDLGNGTYEVHFPDGYWIGLTMDGGSTMTWFSGESGDSFGCQLIDE